MTFKKNYLIGQSLFVVSTKIEDGDEVEVSNWAKHKKTFYSEWYTYTILSSSGSQKKIWTWVHLFSFAAVTVKWQFSNLQFLNFKAEVIPSSLVAILSVLEGSY
jgi:hypothetical protein